MPREKKKGLRVTGDGVKWNGFVPCEFDAESRQRFAAWESDQAPQAHWEWFIEMCDGFKLTFSWSEPQSCYQVSMTGNDPKELMFFGWTLTARGRDVDRTLLALRFKHEVMLQEKWLHEIRGDNRDDNWVG